MTLRELAKEYDDTDLLLAHYSDNKRAWAKLIDLEPAQVWQMLDQITRNERADIRKDALRAMNTIAQGDTPEDKKKRLAGGARRTEKRQEAVFEWPLFGGKPLRECRVGDLMESVGLRREQIMGQEMAADFEEAIALLLPNNKVTVGKTLTAEAISEAYREIYVEAA